MHRPTPSHRPLLLLAAAVAVTTLAAGCTSTVPGVPTPAGATPASTTADAPVPTDEPDDSLAADGTDLGACADGECEVLVDGPAEIPVPAGSEITSLRVEDAGGRLAIVIENRDGGTSVMSGSGSSVSVGSGYRVQVETVDEDSVVLRLTVGR